MPSSRWDSIRKERGWDSRRTSRLASRHTHYPRIASEYSDDGGTTTSTSFTDLTGGESVSATVDVGPLGMVLVLWKAQMANDTASAFCIMSIAVSGANTIAASDAQSLNSQQAANDDTAAGTHHLYTGLAPGPTTFTAKYRVTAGTGTWDRMEVTAWSMDFHKEL